MLFFEANTNFAFKSLITTKSKNIGEKVRGKMFVQTDTSVFLFNYSTEFA